MSETLRERFEREMLIRGYADRTRASYAANVSLMVRRTGLHPAHMTEEDVSAYLASLLNDYNVSASTYRQHATAIRLFFLLVLDRRYKSLADARPKREQKLPSVPTVEEVRRLIRAVRSPAHRMAITLAYSCGLRSGELCAARTDWIEGDGRILHVHDAKGGKDRLVPLPPRTLELLRQYWRECRPPGPLFFPSRLIPGRSITPDAVRRALLAAAEDANIHRKLKLHSLRHAYATHLHDRGVDLRIIQRYLGHAHTETTAIYARLGVPAENRAQEALEELTRDL